MHTLQPIIMTSKKGSVENVVIDDIAFFFFYDEKSIKRKYIIETYFINLRPIFIPETHRKYLCKKRKADKS
jgi:hypothetical protein